MIYLDWMGTWSNEKLHQVNTIFSRGLLRPGGLLLADNVLWDGKVVSGDTDTDTRLIDAFNQKVLADARFQNLILPLRDGLLLAQRV